VISVKVEKPGYHPVFSREQLGEVQTFSVEVVEDAGRDFLVGVATSELRNCKN
jgi:hypothetical protein